MYHDLVSCDALEFVWNRFEFAWASFLDCKLGTLVFMSFLFIVQQNLPSVNYCLPCNSSGCYMLTMMSQNGNDHPTSMVYLAVLK
jgi:hypothetical protein